MKCKELYFSIIIKDPLFAIRCYFTKFRDCLVMEWEYLLGTLAVAKYTKIPFLVLPIAICSIDVLDKEREHVKCFFVIFILGFVISVLAMVEEIIGIPEITYGWGAVGGAGVTVAMLFLYSICAIFARVEKRLKTT